jgi:hypothetical protein
MNRAILVFIKLIFSIMYQSINPNPKQNTMNMNI